MKYFCVSDDKLIICRNILPTESVKYLLENKKSKTCSPRKSIKNCLLLPFGHPEEYPQFLDDNKFQFTKAVMYRTFDLSDLENVFYDILVFYSPSGLRAYTKTFQILSKNYVLRHLDLQQPKQLIKQAYL